MPGIGFRVGADTLDQIQHCLKCNRKYCINCLLYLRVGQIPGKDPCLTCASKNRCKTKKCSQKSQFESSVKSNPHLLDRDWVSAEYAGSRIKKGEIIFVASSKGPVPREIVKVNKTSFRTCDDLYYFTEHRKLWWFSEAGARGDKNDKAR